MTRIQMTTTSLYVLMMMQIHVMIVHQVLITQQVMVMILNQMVYVMLVMMMMITMAH